MKVRLLFIALMSCIGNFVFSQNSENKSQCPEIQDKSMTDGTVVYCILWFHIYKCSINLCQVKLLVKSVIETLSSFIQEIVCGAVELRFLSTFQNLFVAIKNIIYTG